MLRHLDWRVWLHQALCTTANAAAREITHDTASLKQSGRKLEALWEGARRTSRRNRGVSRSCLSISPCSKARQSNPWQSRDPKSSSVLASSTAAATEPGREDYHRLALEDIARIGAVQVKDMLVAVSHLTQPHSHATVVNLQAFTTAQRAPGCSRDPTVRAAPVAHRVPVQVNRACVWRHALPQRPDPLHPNDAVVIVIGLAVVDGEAVVEAAGGG